MADAVTWSANTDLTLSAHNNIYINANITASHNNAGLNLEYGLANKAAGNQSDYYLAQGVKVNLQEGQNFSTKLGSNGGKIDYTVITKLGNANSNQATDLQGINKDLAGKYVLGADIDVSATATWNKSGQNYLGFKPLGGDSLARFTGRFDGLGHSITDLIINRPNENYVGLFGYTNGSGIRNVHIQDGVVNGKQYAGGLVGYSSNGTISNSSASSDVIVRTGSGSAVAGGLVGYSSNVTISNSSASGDVLMNSTSTSTTTTYASAGGLVGENQGVILNSFASGNITSDAKKNADAGGLVGWNESGTISNSYASGDATSNATSGAYAGGLVGYTGGKGSLSKSFASGNVTANATSGAYSGGLVGASNISGSISNAYASGMV